MITEWSRDGRGVVPRMMAVKKNIRNVCALRMLMLMCLAIRLFIGLCVPDVDDVRLFRDVDGVLVQHSQPVFL